MHLKIVCCRRTEPLCAVMHARLSRRFLAELWRETKRIFMSDPDQVVDQDKPDRRIVVTALGVTQILAWGSTFYLLGVLANPIARDTGWDYDWVISGVSAGLLMAGVVSPRVGRAISKWGGRRALALSTVLLAAGLLLLGASQSIAWYLAAWLLVGAGMGSGLTDAAFSTLGSIYGDDARSPITSLTLFAGFASTVCWPLSAYLVEHLGWRGACFTYAAIQIGVALPILLLALPGRSFITRSTDDEGTRARASLAPSELPIFALLAGVLTLSAAILSMLGIHLLPLLQARGLELSMAVGLGAIVGPSQVGARIVEMLAGRRYHPIWTMVASAVLVAIGTGLLYADFPAYSVAIVLYGAGNGLGSVARGTLALALFGSSRYPMLMGRLALPILMSMALSPFLGAIAFEAGGANLTLGLIAFLGAANVLLVGLLWTLSTRRPTSG
jgi:predicted MFS family arabinose efflux permease